MFIDSITPPKPPGQRRNNNDEEPSMPQQNPSFTPPEEIRGDDELVDFSDTHSGKDHEIAEQSQNRPSRNPFKKLHLSQKQAIILSAVLIVILGGGGIGAYKLFIEKDPPAPVVTAVVEEEPEPEPPAPTTVASPLTGIQTSPELAQLPVTGVMIENSPEARPQSGLKDAGIVYEAIAEGGITRFMALYQESQPDYVGPVRSVRPYYLDWLQGYNAGIAHVGGSPEALAKIKSDGVRDLDQFYNSGGYWRVSSRYAPHNMYTAVQKLIDLQISKGYTTSSFTGFARKEDKPASTPLATSIDFTISSYLYNVRYDYDAASNSYKRSEGGKAHVDEKSGTQLQPKVVVGIIVPYSKASDGVHSVYGTIGSGRAYVFQDGVVTTGTWSKSGSKEPLVLKDDAGTLLALNAGQTWISVMGTQSSVAYK